jgi:ABC-type amino acid transport system permease subunit
LALRSLPSLSEPTHDPEVTPDEEELVLAQPGIPRPGVPGLAIGLVAPASGSWPHNTLHNMQVRGIQSGFDFLSGRPASTSARACTPFDSAEPYWQAFLVGLSTRCAWPSSASS